MMSLREIEKLVEHLQPPTTPLSERDLAEDYADDRVYLFGNDITVEDYWPFQVKEVLELRGNDTLLCKDAFVKLFSGLFAVVSWNYVLHPPKPYVSVQVARSLEELLSPGSDFLLNHRSGWGIEIIQKNCDVPSN